MSQQSEKKKCEAVFCLLLCSLRYHRSSLRRTFCFPLSQFLETLKCLKYMTVRRQNWENELMSGAKPSLEYLSKRRRVRKDFSLGSSINMKNLTNHESQLSVILYS